MSYHPLWRSTHHPSVSNRIGTGPIPFRYRSDNPVRYRSDTMSGTGPIPFRYRSDNPVRYWSDTVSGTDPIPCPMISRPTPNLCRAGARLISAYYAHYGLKQMTAKRILNRVRKRLIMLTDGWSKGRYSQTETDARQTPNLLHIFSVPGRWWWWKFLAKFVQILTEKRMLDLKFR